MPAVDVPLPDAVRYHRILIAVDHYDTLLSYKDCLKTVADEIDEATDGREALAKTIAQPTDLLVTETKLPGIDGYALCDLLRRDAATAAMPIVVVTAGVYPADLDRARRAGADSVLVKPCLPHVLLEEVRRLHVRSQDLRRRADDLRMRLRGQIAKAQALQARLPRQTRSRAFARTETKHPPTAVPELVCPSCDRLLVYQHSHVGGVTEAQMEQWDYYECEGGCGVFQYRQRTRKLRRVS
jgi:CheY-like chemotaxis protein